MRAPRGGLLTASLAALLLVAILAALSGTTALDTAILDLKHRWVAFTAPARDVAASDPGEQVAERALGVNVFLEQEPDPDRRTQSLALIRAAGLSWIRQQVPWEQIEPDRKGSYVDLKFGGSTWAKFDQIVEAANASGVKLLLRLDTSPRWALPPDALDGLGPPAHFEDYWDFVEAVAERYRGRVAAYQVWNEPNLAIEWGRAPPDPGAYVRLLRGAADRIRAADPSARVVMAALAPTLTENADAMNELEYLQALYGAGVRGSFDVLAVQAYGLRGGPDDPRIDPTDVTFSRPALVREVMLRNGDTSPVWSTELGWNVNPPDFAEQKFGRVTPMLQARYTVRAFERVRAQWPWMENLFVWYFKRPDDRNANQDWYWFRLADPDFQLQPIYYAIHDYTTAGGK